MIYIGTKINHKGMPLSRDMPFTNFKHLEAIQCIAVFMISFILSLKFCDKGTSRYFNHNTAILYVCYSLFSTAYTTW